MGRGRAAISNNLDRKLLIEITRVWQYPDKPRHITIAVNTPAKVRQFDAPVDTPFGQYLLARMQAR